MSLLPQRRLWNPKTIVQAGAAEVAWHPVPPELTLGASWGPPCRHPCSPILWVPLPKKGATAGNDFDL